ncbi:MAG: hypothetical protein AAF568_06140, partial [Pseudomonadota bacterium]
WPTLSLIGLSCLCWAFCEVVVGRWRLIWPGSALGIIGPLSLGFALALSTPELRMGPFLPRLAIIAAVAGVAMIPFLFRFKLPGLVSPIMTFSLVGLFLTLYGADMDRLREIEGFSPRGIVAALMDEPHFVALFGVFGVVATVMARRLDMQGGNFGLAAARPLHLVGGGVAALVLGRLLAYLPQPLDLVGLTLAWTAAWLWTLRVNRIAVLFAMHYAMAKPVIQAIAELWGAEFTLWQWSYMLGAILVLSLAVWPIAHKASRDAGWTLGPGGIIPPESREGWLWRFWPYAGEKAA